eukprot:IDg14544t1
MRCATTGRCCKAQLREASCGNARFMPSQRAQFKRAANLIAPRNVVYCIIQVREAREKAGRKKREEQPILPMPREASLQVGANAGMRVADPNLIEPRESGSPSFGTQSARSRARACSSAPLLRSTVASPKRARTHRSVFRPQPHSVYN